MPNIIFFSENEGFIEDLREQISLSAPEYKVYAEAEYNPEIIYDLVLIDDQAHILNYIREHNLRVPVIYFTNKDNKKLPFSSTDIVVKKPFSLDSFLDFLKSSIASFFNKMEGSISLKCYEFWPMKKEIINKTTHEIVKLTEKEVAIILYLYRAIHRAHSSIITKTELLEEVWGYSPESTTHTIETHIYRLRSKVEGTSTDYPIIITEEGGYRINI